MSKVVFKRVEVGEVGVVPGTIKMTTDDGWDDVTDTGYLNGVIDPSDLSGLSTSDIIYGFYQYDYFTQSGIYCAWGVVRSDGLITLIPYQVPLYGVATTSTGTTIRSFDLSSLQPLMNDNDILVCSLATSSNACYILTAACTSDPHGIVVTFNTDPGVFCNVAYTIYKNPSTNF